MDDYLVTFHNRGEMPSTQRDRQAVLPLLSPDTYEKAREAAPGWDVRALEAEWREWATTTPRNPDAAFVGFCRKVFEKRGAA